MGGKALSIQGGPASANFIPANTTGYSYAVLLQPLDTTTFGRTMDCLGRGVLNIYTNVADKQGQGAFSTSWRNAHDAAINPYVPFVVGKWYMVCCTVQQGLGCMYVNGQLAASDKTVSIANCVSNQSGQLVYNATGDGSQMPNANFSSFYCWNNRVLTAAEAATLYASPWQIIG
jgi:hypothetical protein